MSNLLSGSGARSTARPKTVIFANSKGGVGKSTLALLMGLGLATRHQDASVKLIDLDPQATSSDSLRRFCDMRFSVVNDTRLNLVDGGPDNENIVKTIDAERNSQYNKRFVVLDSAAGSDPSRSPFLFQCDIMLIPTSVSDADIFATKKYLADLHNLFSTHEIRRTTPPPALVVLPNLVDSREEFNELRHSLVKEQVYLGKPLYYSPAFRRAFREQRNDENIRTIFQQAQPYTLWLTSLLTQSHRLEKRPKKLFQL